MLYYADLKLNIFLLSFLATILGATIVHAEPCNGLGGTPILVVDRSALKSFEDVKALDDDDIVLIDPKITFTDEEVAASLKAIKEMLNYVSSTSVEYTQTYHKGVRTRRLDPTLLPSVHEKLDLVERKIWDLFLRLKGSKPDYLSVTLRATSNNYGFSVSERTGGNAEGLHDHINRHYPQGQQFEFLWALKGPGVRIKLKDGTIKIIPQGTFALFGPRVMHGSPNTDADRLIIVGSAMAFADKDPRK